MFIFYFFPLFCDFVVHLSPYSFPWKSWLGSSSSLERTLGNRGRIPNQLRQSNFVLSVFNHYYILPTTSMGVESGTHGIKDETDRHGFHIPSRLAVFLSIGGIILPRQHRFQSVSADGVFTIWELVYTNIMGEGCLAMVWSSAAREGYLQLNFLFCFALPGRLDRTARQGGWGIALTVVSWLFLFFPHTHSNTHGRRVQIGNGLVFFCLLGSCNRIQAESGLSSAYCFFCFWSWASWDFICVLVLFGFLFLSYFSLALRVFPMVVSSWWGSASRGPGARSRGGRLASRFT